MFYVLSIFFPVGVLLYHESIADASGHELHGLLKLAGAAAEAKRVTYETELTYSKEFRYQDPQTSTNIWLKPVRFEAT